MALGPARATFSTNVEFSVTLRPEKYEMGSDMVPDLNVLGHRIEKMEYLHDPDSWVQNRSIPRKLTLDNGVDIYVKRPEDGEDGTFLMYHEGNKEPLYFGRRDARVMGQRIVQLRFTSYGKHDDEVQDKCHVLVLENDVEVVPSRDDEHNGYGQFHIVPPTTSHRVIIADTITWM